MRRLKVYMAGPYTKGDQALNVRRILKAADRIVDAGHIPFVPHLYHFWHMLSPKLYEVWMDLDREWLTVCDVMIRMSGESSGSDQETKDAHDMDMPVYETVDAFLAENRELS